MKNISIQILLILSQMQIETFTINITNENSFQMYLDYIIMEMNQ